jgi:three-Cys-motif partner protein
MSTPSDTLWEMEPHTGAKHAILRRYLGAWFGIMGTTNPHIVYLDGFCGPGRYKGGEDGSPILAIKLAQEHHQKNHLHEVTFLFVEERKDRIEHLQNELSGLPVPPATLHISVIHNQFDNTLLELLDDLDTRGAKLAPTFAFIDPFGFKGAPFKLVQRLLKNPKTEVFINIMADSINRFLDHPDPLIKNHIVDLFGTPQVLQIINTGRNGIAQLRGLYQAQLEKCAKFVRYFEMRDEDNRVIYYLFFATNNRLGHIKMKEAFWKVDSSNGYHFSDATNANQLVLFEEDPSKSLAELLTTQFQGQRITVSVIQEYVEDHTPYLASHMKKAFRQLEEQDRLCVDPCKQGGAKRKKGTFPEGVVVTFPNNV